MNHPSSTLSGSNLLLIIIFINQLLTGIVDYSDEILFIF